ncbi:barstar family protein [Geobacter hydrogenophilus]|uniref:Barnase inhibitor n=1 Tax=Geobacter hydrogenophilus TaxID=40983 RepID=A0A9W6G3Z9_9BACT|nr:barstar family protein [Geobacter hydrogenophilus]MBT0892557.1 barstar family protein [Geobacter hydrogenophilus]GLI39954.1 barnase inhibitor [Geobacter hydrogenophilus]
MSVKRCTISGRSVHSLNELYDELARQLPLPDYFGRNLDALWDVLSTDIEGPVELIWEDSEHSKRSMGKDYERVVSLLRDLAKEREDFRVIFR